MLRGLRGRLDEGNRQFVRGWAASGGRRVDVTICLRGQEHSVAANVDRPDLEPLGLPLHSGFMLIFPERLADGESAEVLLPNGKQIQNSPFVYAEQDLSTAISGRRLGVADAGKPRVGVGRQRRAFRGLTATQGEIGARPAEQQVHPGTRIFPKDMSYETVGVSDV